MLTVLNAAGFWTCRETWRRSAYNTMWCLIGCSTGDLGTILFFQWSGIQWAVLLVMGLAMVNGLVTSVMLETVILRYGGMDLSTAFKTAFGMSFVSMLAMEAVMNATDFFLVGGAKIVFWALPFIFLAGFVAPWPYNYWRLRKYGKACH